VCVRGNDQGVMCVFGGMTEGSCVFEGMTEGPVPDVNATSWPRRVVALHGKAVAGPWRSMARLGQGSASRYGCARMRAGPGLPGPRCGRAVRGAPASWACGTTQRRRGDGGILLPVLFFLLMPSFSSSSFLFSSSGAAVAEGEK
jgi:hypothetical protein